MPVSNFEQLCLAACEAAGVAPPVLEEDEFGLTAFTFEVRNSSICVARHRERPEAAVIMASLGQVAAQDDAPACQMLMESNFLMAAEPDHPSIGRSPATGEFILSFWRHFDFLSGTELYASVERIAELGERMRGIVAAARRVTPEAA